MERGGAGVLKTRICIEKADAELRIGFCDWFLQVAMLRERDASTDDCSFQACALRQQLKRFNQPASSITFPMASLA